MFEKYIAILKSSRFWQVVVASIAVYLGNIGTITPEMAELIATILGVSVTIGTVDKFRK